MQAGVWGYSGNGPGPATRVVAQRGAPGAAFTADFSKALPPITTCNLSATPDGAPKAIWSSAPMTNASGASVFLQWGSPIAHGWQVIVPSTATSAAVPNLPADAADWDAPSPGADSFEPPDVVFAGSDTWTPATFRASVATLVPNPFRTVHRAQDIVIAANGSYVASEYYK
jgi:hypothetical protein